MLRPLLLTLFILATHFATAGETESDAPGGQSRWLLLEVKMIGVASAEALHLALEQTLTANYEGLLIQLDTPGGSLEATREMVQSIMGAKKPVCLWVGPAGARAGSAGAFLTLAALQSAMAPGTNIGAAHPIQASGDDLQPGAAGEKVLHDTAAFIESIARARGRNTDLARSFVTESVSISAEEAVSNKIVDFIAKDPQEFLSLLNDRTLTLDDGTTHTLATTGAEVVVFDKSFRLQVLEILSNPNLFYHLFLAGLMGLGYELTHPGLLIPGVIGAICLLLAFIATSVLPISWGAAALVLLGIAMLVAEVFVPSFGILGIGGLVAFVLGSIFLVDPANTEGLRISLGAILPGTIFIAGTSLWIAYLILQSRRSRSIAGQSALIGGLAEVMEDFRDGRGTVRIAGEIWKAIAKPGAGFVADKGSRLRVTQVTDLTLEVEPCPHSADAVESARDKV